MGFADGVRLLDSIAGHAAEACVRHSGGQDMLLNPE